MLKDSNDIDKRLKSFKELFRDSGIKLTHQRLEIFKEIVQSQNHPDAETVFQNVRQRIPTISLDTVYRTLWKLKDLELIHSIGTPKESTRFDANLKQHHHFVCKVCGKMRDFYSEQLNDLQLPDAIGELGIAKTTHVEVRGICRDCEEKQ